MLTRDNNTLREQVDNCMQSETRTQRHYQDLIERMRVDNAHMIRTLQEKHEYDKTALRSEYESLIGTIREEYQTQKGELREHMKKLELELSLHEKDFKQVRAKFDDQIANQANEILQQKETIQQQNMQIIDLTQKKNLAESENMRLHQELGSLS